MFNIDIVRRLLAIVGKPDSLIRHVADRLGHDRRYAVDASRLRTELGWRPQHDLDGALEYTQRALAIDERVYGAEHPNVAIRTDNIGKILQDQGDLASALEYTQRALTILQNSLGAEHPRTRTAAASLAALKAATDDAS